jgi:serine/threonine protein phosphatase PrpC
VSAENDVIISPDERAIEAGYLSQPGQTDGTSAKVGFYQPDTLSGVMRQGRLFVLAEGLSGSGSGAMAGQYAVQKMIRGFYSGPVASPGTQLDAALQQTNADIFARNAQFPDRRPMAATLTAALVLNNKLTVATVGDAQVFVAWDQDVEMLQPQPAESTPAAAPSPEGDTDSPPPPDAIEPPPITFTDKLPPALGLTPEVKITRLSRRLFPGDVVVMCSGGLSGYLTPPEIARAVNRYDTETAIHRLLDLAAERDYRDQSAICVIRVSTEPLTDHPPVAVPLPLAPQWNDWKPNLPPRQGSSTPAIVPKKPVTMTGPVITTPPAADSPATATASLEKPVAARLPGTNFSRTALTPPSEKSGFDLNWKIAVAVIAVMLLITCAVPALVVKYLAPPELLARLPLAETVGLTLPTAVPIEPEVALPEETIEPTAAAGPTAPVVESNSPLPTPETQFSSPVGTPTPQTVADTVPTPPPSPTPTAPLLPTIAIPAGCENRARFGADVTIPDGTQLASGDSFEKGWRVSNAAECPWGPGYTVRLMEGEAMSAPPQIQLVDRAEPDENYEIRIPLVAPTAPGTYRATWQLHDLQGQPFGPDLYLEIEVLPAAASANANAIFDFIASADTARWTSGETEITVSRSEISESLPLPSPLGLVVVGQAQLRGNKASNGEVLLTYPDQSTGVIEGRYSPPTPLNPGDTVSVELGFPKLSILSDDGVTFEISFAPAGGAERLLLSQTVTYQASPVTALAPLTDIAPNTTGQFTLRVLSGDTPNQDWALWVSARIVRP